MTHATFEVIAKLIWCTRVSVRQPWDLSEVSRTPQQKAVVVSARRGVQAGVQDGGLGCMSAMSINAFILGARSWRLRGCLLAQLHKPSHNNYTATK